MHSCAWITCGVARSSMAAPPSPTTAQLVTAAELLRALANEHRVGILLQLERGERCVHELVDVLGVTQPVVSQHLRVLRAQRLVTSRRRGREVAYTLSDDHVAHIVRDAVTHASERTHG